MCIRDSFNAELNTLLKEYAGRPSLLYYAQKMTQDLGGAKIYIKREDLNHTGSHKINNVLGQALLAKKLSLIHIYILRCLASAIETVGGEDFLFCRVAADHFAGLLPYRDKRELTDWFRRLEAELRTIGGRDGLPAVNICVGFYCPGDGDALLDMNAMVNRAHMAQQSVKNGSGSGCAVFSKELRDQIRRDSELESRSRAALEQGEFVVYMQPKVDIQQGDAIGGAEALVRLSLIHILGVVASKQTPCHTVQSVPALLHEKI